MLCPRCDIGILGFKKKPKKFKEPVPNGKKRSTKLESLSDLERALYESKDTAAAVCICLDIIRFSKSTFHLLDLFLYEIPPLFCIPSAIEVHSSNFLSSITTCVRKMKCFACKNAEITFRRVEVRTYTLI